MGGERTRVTNNNLLGSFTLSTLSPMPHRHPLMCALPYMKMTSYLVSAEEKTTCNKNEITITNNEGRLSPEETRRMIQEAEEDYSAEDKKFLRRAKIMNDLDDQDYKIKNALKKEDISSKLNSHEKEDINYAKWQPYLK